MRAVPGPTRLSRAVREFLQAEAAGGIVLVVAAVVALGWANSPWDGAYRALWSTELRVELGRWVLTEDLRHWVNDALMAIFFFVVGLEIKRELVDGELRDPRQAAVPALAALGGMVVPAVLFGLITLGSAGDSGWGIPMATDIAFAVGVVALFGSRVSPALKLFLLTLAVVDDIGAIVVIALFYSEGVDLGALAAAGALLVAIVAVRRAGVEHVSVYALLGAGVWLATYQSGVHATIAGVVLGLMTPARPEGSPSVAEGLQHALHPLSSFAIVPIFALANAGVRIEGDALDAPGANRVVVAVVVGLVAGKLLGILGATWLAVRSGLGRIPEGATWAEVAGVAVVAGIGFTVSLFIAGLAFEGPELEAAAKLGVLGASVAAAALGSLVLAVANRRGAADGGG